MVACSADWSAGSATFTTVPSIKAMLEPRMVAAMIQPPPEGAGSMHGFARITASSQGGLAMVDMTWEPNAASAIYRVTGGSRLEFPSRKQERLQAWNPGEFRWGVMRVAPRSMPALMIQTRGPGLFAYRSTIASAVRRVWARIVRVGLPEPFCGKAEPPRRKRFDICQCWSHGFNTESD